eukprot:XP_001706401.1 Hypothetical protein GL50803_34892 [Giardia lamblia ATCC 50803]
MNKMVIGVIDPHNGPKVHKGVKSQRKIGWSNPIDSYPFVYRRQIYGFWDSELSVLTGNIHCCYRFGC